MSGDCSKRKIPNFIVSLLWSLSCSLSLWEKGPIRSAASLWPQHPLLPEFSNLLGAVAEFRQHFLVVLAQERRRTSDAGRGFRKFEWRVGHAQLGHPGVGHFGDHVPGEHLGVVDHVRHPVDGTAGHSSLGDYVYPVGHGPGVEYLTEGCHTLGAVGHPIIVGLEARVFHQIGPSDGLTEALPQPLVGTTHDEEAIGSGEGLVRHQAGMARPHAVWLHPGSEVAGGMIAHGG